MDAKVFISLVSVALGWLLGQGTAIIKDWIAARKMRRGLITELEDIQDQLQRVLMIHHRHLQLLAHNAIGPESSLPIQNMFFRQCFKDAFLHLNREQRISYQLIHASLEFLNKKADDLAKYAEEFFKSYRTEPDEKKNIAAIHVWGDRVVAIYKTTMDVRWHIAYHLHNSKVPSFDIMGPMHESYVKFQQELDDEVKTIIEDAKKFKLEDFLKIYDEKFFAQNRNVN